MLNDNNGRSGNDDAEKQKPSGGVENTEPSKDVPANTEPSRKKVSFYKKRSFKFGSMATAFTAIFVAIVILVNVGLTLLAQKYPISADLTKSKSYCLSSETLKYIAKIDQPITIKIFATKDQMESQSYLMAPVKIIQQYPRYNPKISIQYIDYDKNPTSVAKYTGENVAMYDIIVSKTDADGRERYKHIAASDLLVTTTDSSTGQETVLGNKAEQQIDNALDYVTNTKQPTVVFTQGHNESDSSGFQTLLKENNYNVSTVNTTSSAIDSNASAIAIVAPQADFSANEITKIDSFLRNGGKYGKNIFIFLDPRCPTLNNLDEYIQEWGVKVGKGLIYDTSNSFDNNPSDPISTDIDTSVVGKNVSTKIGTDVKIALPLTVLFDSKDTRAAASVIKTSSTSQLLEDLDKQPSTSDKKGPFTTMTHSTWSGSDLTTSGKSNMIVSGSYMMMDSNLLNAPNKNNSKVLSGIANTLMQKQSAVNVDSKYNDSTQLSLTTSQRYFIIALFIVIIPIAVLILGLVQWLRRRHL